MCGSVCMIIELPGFGKFTKPFLFENWQLVLNQLHVLKLELRTHTPNSSGKSYMRLYRNSTRPIIARLRGECELVLQIGFFINHGCHVLTRDVVKTVRDRQYPVLPLSGHLPKCCQL